MNNVYFGIVIGIFLCFAVQRFLVFAKNALQDRKVNEIKKAEETVKMIVDRVTEKIQKKS